MNRSKQVALLTLVSGAALAQTSTPAASPLKLVLSQALVETVTKDGKSVENLKVDPKSVLPGAVLEQNVTATNTLKKAMGNIIVDLPVPDRTTYLNGMAASGDAKTLFSFDKGKTFGAAPLKRMITVTENGKSVQKEVEVKPSEYTNVRWVVGQLSAGSSLKLGFRVKVN